MLWFQRNCVECIKEHSNAWQTYEKKTKKSGSKYILDTENFKVQYSIEARTFSFRISGYIYIEKAMGNCFNVWLQQWDYAKGWKDLTLPAMKDG